MVKTQAALLKKTCKSLPFESSKPLSVGTIKVLDPGEGEVMVRVMAAGLCKSDISVIKGDITRPLPMVVGHEAAGEVVKVGEKVINFKPGDKVVTTFVPSCGECEYCQIGKPGLCKKGIKTNQQGVLLSGEKKFLHDGEYAHSHVGVSAFSEYITVSEKSLVKVNTDVPYEYLALFGCSVVTGIGAVINTAQLKLGQTVCILGLGGVGYSALLGAKAAGASKIFVVDLNENKLQKAKELDQHIKVYTPTELENTDIQTDFVIETTGAAKAIELGFNLLKRGGTLVTTSLPSEKSKLNVPIKNLTFEEKTIKGSYLGSCIPKRDIPAYLKLFEDGRLEIDKLLSKVITLDEINKGFDELMTGNLIRIVIKF